MSLIEKFPSGPGTTVQRTAAILGCGKYVEGKEGWAIGHAHAKGYRHVDPKLVLYGVDINPENLTAFGSFDVPRENLSTSTEELYRHLVPDFVSVCTWPTLHAPHASVAFVQYPRGAQAIFVTGPETEGGYSLQLRSERGMVQCAGDTLKLFTTQGYREETRPVPTHAVMVLKK